MSLSIDEIKWNYLSFLPIQPKNKCSIFRKKSANDIHTLSALRNEFLAIEKVFKEKTSKRYVSDIQSTSAPLNAGASR